MSSYHRCRVTEIVFPIGAEDYAILGGAINIPIGADIGETYCRDITLASDSKVEEEEEIFSVSLMTPVGDVPYVLVPDKNATVTIRDRDSKGNFIPYQIQSLYITRHKL